jgi:outer membrane receptor protein involved in Fe transport
LIPVLESRFRLSPGTFLASTLFGDASDLYGNRSEQFGFENTLSSGPWLWSLSLRHVHFKNETNTRETPFRAGVNREFQSTGSLRVKVGVDAVRVEDTGIEPGGRISARWRPKGSWTPVVELASVAKMPTLSARRYVLDTGTYRYRGNPALLPERVWSAVAALEQTGARFQSKWTLKAEARTDSQINTSNLTVNTTLNAGMANLLSAQGEARVTLSPSLLLRAGSLLSWSRLEATGLPYPDLPSFSWNGGWDWGLGDEIRLETDARYFGSSTAFDGSPHAAYLLVDQHIRWFPSADLEIRAGISNLFDQRAELVAGFPLPGRLLRASVSAGF